MISPIEAKQIRLRIIITLDCSDPTDRSVDREIDGTVFVDIDKRYVDDVWKDDATLQTWLRSWNIEASEYDLPHCRRQEIRSKWMRFTKKKDIL